jgi:hypothetical protein
MKTALMALVLASAACGGTSKPDSTASTAPADPPGGAATARAQVDKFHDTLAPRWHAAQGPQRMADTCAAMSQFRAETDAIAAAPAPGSGDPATWSSHTKQLTDAVGALDVACKANDAVAFEPAFERVHHVFHEVEEATSGGHGGHGEHGKGEHGNGEQGKGEQKH